MAEIRTIDFADVCTLIFLCCCRCLVSRCNEFVHEAKFVAQCHKNQGTGDLCFTKGFSAAIQGQCVDGDGNNEVAARGSGGTGEDVYRQQQHPLSHQQLCHNSTRELKQY
ncbi:uncharacterized protein [Triticum aestivum]|uniref:uncharacterized protein isoform X1 n=1 Tax=Triticum aestivum TaxID=4565 RepID=UPI001D0150E5|nr:uncharacterized protein LOC123166654 isoform X1 [Triticum aestivum]